MDNQVKKEDLLEPLLIKDDSNEVKAMKTTKIERFSSKFYLLFALMAGFSFSLNNFLTDYAVQQVQNLSAVFIIGVPFLALTIIYHIYDFQLTYRNNGFLWSKVTSSYYKDGKFNWYIFKIVLARGLYLLINFSVYISVQLLAFRAGANSSMIVSLFSGAAIFTAIFFHFFFHEKLFLKHYLGILIITVGAILIANSKQTTSTQDSNQNSILETQQSNSSVSLWIPILLALLQNVMIATGNCITRLAKQEGFPIMQFTFDSSIIPSVIYVGAMIYYHFNIDAYKLSEFIPMVIANVFSIIAILCINWATAYGKGGTSQALVQTQSPFQLMLEIIFFSRTPSIIGLSGMACAIAGVLTIIIMK